ncbi:MAG: glycosyl hydrolase, partial [Bacteroidota bacterium]
MFPKESYARCLPVILAGFLFLLTGFRFPLRSEYDQIETVDPDASAETRALYYNLGQLSEEHVLVGHQDALAYGVNWKDWHKRRSDMHDIYGQHPALVGWELSKLGSSALNIDSVRFDEMQGWIKQVYKMGGVNTISWHMDNFVTGGNSWEVGERVVATILPGGVHHEAFKAKLDHFAEFVEELEVGWFRKRKIPIIFRPWHE